MIVYQLWRPSCFGTDQQYSEQASERKLLKEQLPHRAVYSAKVRKKKKAWQPQIGRTKSEEEPESPLQTDRVPALPEYALTPATPVPRKMPQIILLSQRECRAFKRSGTTRWFFWTRLSLFCSLHTTMLLLAQLKNLKFVDLKSGIWGGRWGEGKWKGRQGSGVGRCLQAAFLHCWSPLSSLYPHSR